MLNAGTRDSGLGTRRINGIPGMPAVLLIDCGAQVGAQGFPESRVPSPESRLHENPQPVALDVLVQRDDLRLAAARPRTRAGDCRRVWRELDDRCVPRRL